MTLLLTVRSAADLRGLRDPARRAQVRRVALDLGIEAGDQARAELRLNRHLHPCGCAAGAAAMALCMLIGVAGLLAHGPPRFGEGVTFVAITLGIVIAAKAIGYAWGVRRLRQTIDGLALRLEAGETPLPA